MSRPATSFHRLSAVSSIGRSTPRYHSSPARGAASIAACFCAYNAVETVDEISGICRQFSRLHITLHTCGSTLTVGHIWRHFAHAPLWITLCTNAHLYWPATAPLWGTFLPLRPRETDLPAQRAPAEAQARFSCAHGDACGPRDSEAPPCKGPEASLRVKQAPLCNAGTACLARETSMLSTARDARPRPGSWSSTGSSGKRSPASRGSVWRSRGRPGMRLPATGSSGSCARCGASGWSGSRGPRLRLDRQARAPGGGDGERLRVARGAGRRSARRRPRREVRGRRRGLGLPLHAGALPGRRAVQVPPILLAVRDRRVQGVRLLQGDAARGLAPAPLQSLEPRRRRLRTDQKVFK